MKSRNFSLHFNVFTLFISNFVSKIWQFKTRKVTNQNKQNMDRYFIITDSTKVKGGSNASLGGVMANYDEWAKHNFLPKEGVIGFLMGEGYVREGTVYFLECAPNIIVPILPSGVKETTSIEFNNKWRQNLIIGHATQDEILQAKSDEMINSMMSQFGF